MDGRTRGVIGDPSTVARSAARMLSRGESRLREGESADRPKVEVGSGGGREEGIRISLLAPRSSCNLSHFTWPPFHRSLARSLPAFAVGLAFEDTACASASARQTTASSFLISRKVMGKATEEERGRERKSLPERKRRPFSLSGPCGCGGTNEDALPLSSYSRHPKQKREIYDDNDDDDDVGWRGRRRRCRGASIYDVRTGRGSWKSRCRKGGCVNFIVEIRSKCRQRARGSKIPNFCGHHQWKPGVQDAPECGNAHADKRGLMRQIWRGRSGRER